jgi:5-methyltetrahydrofolate--homocysteine methyltransferase
MIRERTANRKSKRELVDYRAANRAALKLDWANYTPPTPAFVGTRVLDDYPLEKLIDYIDWTPFFITWSLAGKYPAILCDEKVGAAARDLFQDAQEMLTQIVNEKLITARAVFGFWEGNSVGNDVQLGATGLNNKIHFLRQQMPKQEDNAQLCLADFVAPIDSGKKDYLGGFAVTAGIGAEAIAKSYQEEGNDYASLMIKALADRLAEAFAEHLHERVRAEFWAYAPNEKLSAEELISERYRGIRPAPGYPACPEHSEKETLFSLLDAEAKTGISLTDSYAMTPAASVSGYYFSHPESRYFSVGKISSEQVEDLATRSSRDFKELSRLLGPNLE